MTRTLQVVDPVNRVFVLSEKETFKNIGYNLDNGNYLWETSPLANGTDHLFWTMSGMRDHVQVGYGMMYECRYGGLVYCWDTKNGELLWTYGNGGAGNNTNTGLATPWNYWPTWIFAIGDGKIFTLNGEHSPNTPLYRGAQTRCLDAYSGEEIWTLSGIGGYPGRTGAALADGIFTYVNLYDMQIYAIGKGPSSTAVSIQNDVIAYGNKVLVKGTVTDISAGTRQKEQAARFPSGVPAMSDDSMSAWMEYVYMQKPKPEDATGVEVTLDVIDANGNYRNIGTATSDAEGFYSFDWTPDIEGKYTVIASFQGSESYWPSRTETAFVVTGAEPTPTSQPAVVLPPTEMYIAAGVVAIIIAIAIGFAVTILILRKRP